VPPGYIYISWWHPASKNLLRLEAGYPALRCHNLEEGPPHLSDLKKYRRGCASRIANVFCATTGSWCIGAAEFRRPLAASASRSGAPESARQTLRRQTPSSSPNGLPTSRPGSSRKTTYVQTRKTSCAWSSRCTWGSSCSAQSSSSRSRGNRRGAGSATCSRRRTRGARSTISPPTARPGA